MEEREPGVIGYGDLLDLPVQVLFDTLKLYEGKEYGLLERSRVSLRPREQEFECILWKGINPKDTSLHDHLQIDTLEIFFFRLNIVNG